MINDADTYVGHRLVMVTSMIILKIKIVVYPNLKSLEMSIKKCLKNHFLQKTKNTIKEKLKENSARRGNEKLIYDILN